MPIVKISILNNRTKTEIQTIHAAIHNALKEAFGIPEHDYNHQLFIFDKNTWLIPPGKTDKFIQIEISMFKGRSNDTKRVLYQYIIKNLSDMDMDPADIFILLNEQPLINWAIKGGIPADEVNLGYAIEV